MYLDGQDKPEIEGELPLTDAENRDLFLAARSDNFAPLDGQLAHVALFDRVLSVAEAKSLFTLSQPDTVG